MKRHALSIVALFWALIPTLAVAADDEAQSLFDGKSLEGWDGDPQFWSVKDGAITGQTTKENPTRGNTFIIWRGGKTENFELTLKFKIQGGNSGVQYRSKEIGKWVIGGYQADFDGDNAWTGTLYEERARGILAKRGQKVVWESEKEKREAAGEASEKEIVAAVKKGDWNEYAITAQGNHLVHKVNGVATVDFTDNQASKRTSSGLLALQLHAGPPMTVQFKDIKLKVLK